MQTQTAEKTQALHATRGSGIIHVYYGKIHASLAHRLHHPCRIGGTGHFVACPLQKEFQRHKYVSVIVRYKNHSDVVKLIFIKRFLLLIYFCVPWFIGAPRSRNPRRCRNLSRSPRA